MQGWWNKTAMLQNASHNPVTFLQTDIISILGIDNNSLFFKIQFSDKSAGNSNKYFTAWLMLEQILMNYILMLQSKHSSCD